MTSLEKAARAAFEAADGADWNDPDSLNLHDDYRAIARAVLLAVREPENADKRSAIGNAIWCSRIDAILQEKGDG
jgi:hypothetical protein